jgi:hypothetical protein
MLDPQLKKRFYSLCSKLTYVFTDFYILTTGYILSIDKEKPFVVQVDDEKIKWFKEVCGDFKILHMEDIKEFKKGFKEDTIQNVSVVTSPSETKRITAYLTEKLKLANSCQKWETFILADKEKENEKLILSLFKNNNFIEFKPKSDGIVPEIILTKSLIPLVSEKNYTNLYYSVQEVSKDLYLIVFDFEFELFRLYMFHYYIDISKEEKKKQ